MDTDTTPIYIYIGVNIKECNVYYHKLYDLVVFFLRFSLNEQRLKLSVHLKKDSFFGHGSLNSEMSCLLTYTILKL